MSRNRVQELVDRLGCANRVELTEEVAALPGATAGYVAQTAELVEANALRIAGRSSRARAHHFDDMAF